MVLSVPNVSLHVHTAKRRFGPVSSRALIILVPDCYSPGLFGPGRFVRGALRARVVSVLERFSA